MKNFKMLTFLLITLFTLSSFSKEIQIHYLRKDGKASDFGVHVWGDAISEKDRTVWPETIGFKGDSISLDIKEGEFYLMVHNNGQIDINPIHIPNLKETTKDIYLVQGASEYFDSYEKAIAASQKMYDVQFRWIDHKTFGVLGHFDNQNHKVYLYHSASGDIRIDNSEVLVDGKVDSAIELSFEGDFRSESEDFYKRFDYLRSHGFSKIKGDLSPEMVRDIVKEHVVIVIKNHQGEIVKSSGVQKAAVLDELFYYGGDDLGSVVSKSGTQFKLWAPTAQSVSVHLYNSDGEDSFSTLSMKEDNGVFVAHSTDELDGKFYLYEITQFNRESGKVETHFVTDPYSLSLSTNSKKSQIVDLDNSYRPKGWDTHTVREHHTLAHPTDMTIYELHTRDFSIFDETVPENKRGTFAAFGEKQSNGMKHLSELAKSGLTHIHLLPINDMASVNENKDERIDIFNKYGEIAPDSPDAEKTILEVLESLPKDSEKQQEIIAKIKDRDGFNWGYDPHHYMAPEGAYATDSMGASRVLELREAVQSLHESGLRVIADVVYNHTFDNTVLNRVVPDYFYRLDHFGNATKDSCCVDTASENKMVEKLISDSTYKWVKNYRLDGIRFDLMNFLTKDTMREVRRKLDTLTMDKDGVDGKKIYLYGEGWDFGSLRWLLPSETVHQWGAASLKMGLGSFNSTFRDAIKGKGQNERELFIDDSYLTDKTHNRETVKNALRATLNDWNGGIYNEPAESINYLTAHDKATMFDHLIAKVGMWAPMEKVVQMQQMGIGFISLAQGIPFFHAGVEILRSKSGDENSYNSGDWFNRLDFTYTTNNWAKGLPPAWQEENLHAWPNWRERLTRIPAPTKDQIMGNLEWFKTMLQTRKESGLFRMQTKEQIAQKLSFNDNVRNQIGDFDPRLLVMKLDDRVGQRIDPENKGAYILFNTSWHDWLDFYDEDIKHNDIKLANSLANSQEPRLKRLLDNSGAKRDEAFVDKNAGKISVPCMSLMVYFMK